MGDARKILLLEVNEIPYRVIDYYTNAHNDSVIQRLLERSKAYLTICEDQIQLDPWISWPTLHRGVIDEQHRVLHLGQTLDYANNTYPPIWEILASEGRQIGIFGSLHSSAKPKDLRNYRFYVPDFFADEAFVHPQELEAFQKFNLMMTRKSARNVDTAVPIKEAFNFLIAYLRQGMSAGTAMAIATQLVNEVLHPHLKCRRRSIQPAISMDIFLYLMRRIRPDLATFHTNHVAAAMHRFWAATFPDDVLENRMSDTWTKQYCKEIDDAMSMLDDMLGRIKDFIDAHPDYKLLIATSLGQAAVKAEETKGFVTVTDPNRLLSALGLADGEWKEKHAMVPYISVITEAGKGDFLEERLSQLAVNGARMIRNERGTAPLSYDRKESNSFHIFVYFERYSGPSIAVLGNRELSFDDLGLGVFQHQDNIACSARHTPHGVLIVYDPVWPHPDRRRTTISTLDIAPAILDNFNVPSRSYMKGPDPTLLDTGAVGVQCELLIGTPERQRMVQRVD